MRSSLGWPPSRRIPPPLFHTRPIKRLFTSLCEVIRRPASLLYAFQTQFGGRNVRMQSVFRQIFHVRNLTLFVGGIRKQHVLNGLRKKKECVTLCSDWERTDT